MIGFGAALPVMVFAVIAAACGSESGTRQPEPTPPNQAFAPNVERTEILEPCVEDGYCGVFAVSGRLTASAWLDEERMYLTDIEGRIWLLNVETGEAATVLEGLAYPQGVTVLDGRLYVSDLGNCHQEGREYGRECRIPREVYMEYLKEYLSRVRARILSYDIDEFGGLADARIVVDDLPTRGVMHSPNGLTNDGEYVYASIGSVIGDAEEETRIVGMMDELEEIARMDLSGVIARFRPPGGELEVYASGLRNVYGISITPDGTIYGADNDDKAGHLEELNAIVEGGFYGFPSWGTNEAPPEENVIEPLAVLEGIASTYAHPSRDGVYVAYRSSHGFVVDRFDYETWTPEHIFQSPRRHITSILEREGMLYLTTLSGNVHVIDPRVATLPIYGVPGGPFRNNHYVSQIISSMSPIAQSGYDVYLDDARLLYVKSSCSEADRTTWFFLHVVPVDSNDLEEEREEHGFDNLDFTFVSGQGWRSGGSCFVVVELPEYEIREIKTGQTVLGEDGYANVWDAEYRFER